MRCRLSRPAGVLTPASFHNVLAPRSTNKTKKPQAATVLTLLLTPSLLAARYWVVTYIVWIARALAVLGVSRQADIARDWALNRMAKRLKQPEIIWDDLIDTPVAQKLEKTATGKSTDGLQAAE